MPFPEILDGSSRVDRIHVRADELAETARLLAIQEEMANWATEIKDTVGLESFSRIHDGYISGGGLWRRKGVSFDIDKFTKPIKLYDPSVDAFPRYARLFEHRDHWYYRRPLPLFLGEVALKNEPRVITATMQVIKYNGDPEEATGPIDRGYYSSFMWLPEAGSYDPSNESSIESLKKFIDDIREISEHL